MCTEGELWLTKTGLRGMAALYPSVELIHLKCLCTSLQLLYKVFNEYTLIWHWKCFGRLEGHRLNCCL